MQKFFIWSRNFSTLMMEDNTTLATYIQDKLGNNRNFIIPRVSGIENNVAVFQHVINENLHPETAPFKQYIQKIFYGLYYNSCLSLSSFVFLN